MTLPNNNQTKLVKGESKLEFMIAWYVINAVHECARIRFLQSVASGRQCSNRLS